MDVFVRTFLREAWVAFNGDSGANEKLDEAQEDIQKLEDKLAVARKKVDDKVATVNEIRSVNRLLRQIAKEKSEKNNALVISLVHPDENGSKTILKPLQLGNGQKRGVKFDSPNDFLTNGLFKATIMGEFGLKVQITDTDKSNPILRFGRRVLSGVFSTFTKSKVGDLSGVLTASAATELGADIESALKGNDDDSILIVGESKLAKFRVGKNGLSLVNSNNDIKFDGKKLVFRLYAPKLIKKTKNTYINVGSKNGMVTFDLEFEYW